MTDREEVFKQYHTDIIKSYAEGGRRLGISATAFKKGYLTWLKRNGLEHKVLADDNTQQVKKNLNIEAKNIMSEIPPQPEPQNPEPQQQNPEPEPQKKHVLEITII